MSIKKVVKRDGSINNYQRGKITEAIFQAFDATNTGSREEAQQVAQKVEEELENRYGDKLEDKDIAEIQDPDSVFPHVEEIQDIVEQKLMDSGFNETAKSYILYRQERQKARQPDLFEKRTSLKPYEYPELAEYVDAIRHSYWIHTEFNYTADINDYKVNVTDAQKTAIKNSMLAIAQIEVAVKTFWGDVYEKMPKPEIGAVGFTFAESEVRHMEAYSHLLEVLGLNDEFRSLEEVPAIQERIDYLEKVIAHSKTTDNREYTQAILLFSLFIEHVSLFSQFLIIMSFNKYENLFRGISNAVEATSKEEQIHGMFGIDLVNQVKKEHPEWFDDEYEQTTREMTREAYKAEKEIVDWIFEDGELEFLPKEQVYEFIKNRLNNSLESIGFDPEFDVDEDLVKETKWFDEEVIATKHVDFFEKRSINYNKKEKSVTSDDLF